MRLSACLRAPKSACRLLTASFLVAMLIAPAAAETVAQTDSTATIPEWGVTGSAPQTGSSAYTSGKAFSAPNSQQDTAAPAIPAEVSPSSAPVAQAPIAVEQAASKILIMIDKPTQEMKVFVGNVERYTWEVSTGRRGYDTPSGTYTARSMNKIWYSKQWDDAPMPHAIFQHLVCAGRGDRSREDRDRADRRYPERRSASSEPRIKQAAGQAD